MRLTNNIKDKYSDQLVLSGMKKCVNPNATLDDVEILKSQIRVKHFDEVCHKDIDTDKVKETIDIIKDKDGKHSEEYEQLQESINEQTWI